MTQTIRKGERFFTPRSVAKNASKEFPCSGTPGGIRRPVEAHGPNRSRSVIINGNRCRSYHVPASMAISEGCGSFETMAQTASRETQLQACQGPAPSHGHCSLKRRAHRRTRPPARSRHLMATLMPRSRCTRLPPNRSSTRRIEGLLHGIQPRRSPTLMPACRANSAALTLPPLPRTLATVTKPPTSAMRMPASSQAITVPGVSVPAAC